jgi:two-component system phosphate regulon sensor histidine kinase PhoR
MLRKINTHILLLSSAIILSLTSLLIGSILFASIRQTFTEFKSSADILTIIKNQQILISTSLILILISLTLIIVAFYNTLHSQKQFNTLMHQISGDESAGIAVSSNDYSQGFKHLHDLINRFNEDLAWERNKLDILLNHTSDGLLLVDPHGYVLTINKSAARMFDVSENEATGNTITGVVRHYQLVETWQRCRDSGESQIIAFEIPRKRMFIQCAALPITRNSLNFVLLSIQDLTHLRRLEAIRRDFISNVSHELRTPLASLKALTETLLTGALEDKKASQRFVEQIEAEVDSMSILVQELLELSRIESGKVSLRLEAVPPHILLSEAGARLELQAERAGLAINIECAEDLPPALVDPPRIQQVLTNLIHNAIKFTPSGGTITLSATLHNDTILFSVKDTGIGISADDMPRIFERFYKSDKTRSSSGIGLGLAIARHIVEAHHGEIYAESKEGQGSTFSFSIPIAK